MSSQTTNTRKIRRAGIIGSGIMGAGIAAHLANCGVPSLLLKASPGSGRDDARAALAAATKKLWLKSKPSPIYDKSVVDLVEFGTLDDDGAELGDCDWICETVKEDLGTKNSVFEKVARHRARGSIVSTNTSGISLASMVQPMDDEMRAHFLGTHFFNPPRYLKLLELVPGPDTAPEVLESMAHFIENVMGKRVVRAKDTPNFVANRILTFALLGVMREMTRAGLRVEEVDALTGTLIGRSSSATFRTVDLVGLDTVSHAVTNVYSGCPDDEARDLFIPPDWVRQMLENGYYGEKSGGGFYKKTKERDERGKSIILSINPETLEYQPQARVDFDCVKAAKSQDSLEKRLRIMHAGNDPGSRFVWNTFAHMAAYAGNRIPEIAGDIMSIDNAMKWGFGWEMGVFETWDVLGFQTVCERMTDDGLELPPIAKQMLDRGATSFYGADTEGRKSYFDFKRGDYETICENPNVLLLTSVKQSGGVVQQNDSASLVDLGDGILCAEFHSKMNTIDPGIVEIIDAGVDLVNLGQFDGLVLGNQGAHFSAGANLALLLESIQENDWDRARLMVTEFQRSNMSIRFCRGPVVAAPHHISLGGAIEMSQHAARVVYAGETYGGLVEAGAGLLPGGGGTKEMLRRGLAYAPQYLEEANPFPGVRRAFESICMGKVSTSGTEMVELGYVTENDILCENVDHQIKRAKDVCRGMVLAGYKPPRYARLIALGEPARAVFKAALYNLELGGYVSEHDVAVSMHVGNVLTGGDRQPGAAMTEHDVLELECEAFLSLCGMKLTQDRIRHMLITGKPLRN